MRKASTGEEAPPIENGAVPRTRSALQERFLATALRIPEQVRVPRQSSFTFAIPERLTAMRFLERPTCGSRGNAGAGDALGGASGSSLARAEEHTSEIQS